MDVSPPRKRKRTSANSASHLQQQQQQHTPQQRQHSSSSSDILVAAPTNSSPPSGPAMDDGRAAVMGASYSASAAPPASVTARVERGHRLVVSFHDDISRMAFAAIAESPATGPDGVAGDVPSTSNDEGPNARGTYSKAYVNSHPEIERTPRTRESRSSGNRASLVKSESMPDDGSRSLDSGRRRGIHKDLKDFNRRGAAEDSFTGRSSLRSMRSFEETPLRSPLVTRSGGRNAKPEAESPERRSSRFSSRRTYAEEDEIASDEDDDDDDKDQTYDREFVDAHPDDDFYHTGNGWYKRGQRRRSHKAPPRTRDSIGAVSTRWSESSFKFDRNQTIHSTELVNYPNIEFHHCGNGWYKPGPDATGHRNSTIIEASPSESEGLQNVVEDDEAMDEDVLNGTVGRDYANKHPEIEWVHRGNGRYRAKNVSAAALVVNPAAKASETPAEPERDTTTYSKEYVDAHPDEVFHHRGNRRYARGPPPQKWADARNIRKQGGIPQASPAPTTPAAEDNQLYDKSYVNAHPELEFHHRGQGRWARGPRQPRVAQSVVAEEEDPHEEEMDPDELVPTEYVNAHPNETFHHRGQGKWARGLPPLGSNSKTAIRMPAEPAKIQKMSVSASQAGDEEVVEGSYGDDAEQPPAITALVPKAEGPNKFPHLTWHYRGGGKWARISKIEAEEMERIRNGGKPRAKPRRYLDDATAQLDREAAAANGAAYDVGDEDGEADFGVTAASRATTRRRRRANNMNTRDYFNTMDDDMLFSKNSSQKSVSQAPTPRPRVMTEEEDILGEEDLPQLYREEWSPTTEELDESDQLLRERFRPINGAEVFLRGMTKYEPNTRPTKNLIELAENADIALQQLAAEYIELDKLTAPHRRVPGKPAKGGTVPIDPLMWEDKKEADLYDYNFDPRKIGEQDPDAQRIQRDAEGRELRGRRNRSAFNSGTIPGWNFGDDQPLGSRRAVKAPQRFDGVVAPPRKRARNSTTATRGTSQAPSLTPERGMTPLVDAVGLPAVHPKGRWAGHVPKRVQELRGESVAASVGPGPAAAGAAGPAAGGVRSKEGSPARKGRPPGSKNLHKRKDAGIKKGPRKPKVPPADAGGIGAGAGSAEAGAAPVLVSGGERAAVEGGRETDDVAPLV